MNLPTRRKYPGDAEKRGERHVRAKPVINPCRFKHLRPLLPGKEQNDPVCWSAGQALKRRGPVTFPLPSRGQRPVHWARPARGGGGGIPGCSTGTPPCPLSRPPGPPQQVPVPQCPTLRKDTDTAPFRRAAGGQTRPGRCGLPPWAVPGSRRPHRPAPRLWGGGPGPPARDSPTWPRRGGSCELRSASASASASSGGGCPCPAPPRALRRRRRLREGGRGAAGRSGRGGRGGPAWGSRFPGRTAPRPGGTRTRDSSDPRVRRPRDAPDPAPARPRTPEAVWLPESPALLEMRRDDF